VEKIRNSSEKLNSQTEEMNLETTKVNHAAAGLSQISSEAKIAMDEMGVGAKEVLQSTLSLNDHAIELSDSYQELQKKIDQFKIS
ncbi:MAG: hypothetical protein PF447_13420, partial [Spirochaetaceae bacterium]|jgi:methyl-accepting chemotaxis protein|nr:hypothetical protein [Spirochaetaceae bacterium]